jgi:histidinol dehydrogenase
MDVVNRIAPEHLELCIEEPFWAGGMSKMPGQYSSGTGRPSLGGLLCRPESCASDRRDSKVLLTAERSRLVKKSSVISYTRQALEKASDAVIGFAEYEKLDGHANAIKVRFEK